MNADIERFEAWSEKMKEDAICLFKVSMMPNIESDLMQAHFIIAECVNIIKRLENQVQAGKRVAAKKA